MTHFLLYSGWFLFFLAGISADWLRNSLLKKFANANGIENISASPFGYSAAVKQIRQSIPEGPLRNRVKIIELTSGICWLAFLAL
jgi:hypothetical protein